MSAQPNSLHLGHRLLSQSRFRCKPGRLQSLLGRSEGGKGFGFSPDGRWIAYDSDESGRSEVYVRSFPSGPGTWQVSTAGGAFPKWRRDGKELFYVSEDFKLMVVPVSADAKFHSGTPVPLFAVRAGNYDVSSDGQRFVVSSLASDPGSPPLDLFVHWTALLGKNQ